MYVIGRGSGMVGLIWCPTIIGSTPKWQTQPPGTTKISEPGKVLPQTFNWFGEAGLRRIVLVDKSIVARSNPLYPAFPACGANAWRLFARFAYSVTEFSCSDQRPSLGAHAYRLYLRTYTSRILDLVLQRRHSQGSSIWRDGLPEYHSPQVSFMWVLTGIIWESCRYQSECGQPFFHYTTHYIILVTLFESSYDNISKIMT